MVKKYVEPPGNGAEIPLLGGDVTEGLVRVGDTVRRPPVDNSPLVIAVLDHLEAVGFAGAPRFLGVDDADRLVLSYLDGEVAGRPRPDWIADQDRLQSVARLLRSFDDAMIDFGLPDITGEINPDPPGIPPPRSYPATFIGHRDVTPENVVFRDGRAVGLIDFDLARPSTRMQEVQGALVYWAPIADPADRDRLLQDVDVFARARTFVDAYGLDDHDRADLVEDLRYGTERSWHLMRDRAERLGGGWARMWDDGIGDQIRRRGSWLEEHGERLTAALVEGR
ncbi:phosphotransferase [Microlunatus soli]|uniref:Phosphotransferase enzyme family protein n=1 Tax=Microlunatus soli TaxID=630515 RepID=A0A1H1XJW0_9ACTN|nr:phosphotransferase [Microlunatus soli]SDT08996.1 Phosphotransferase enzyme family protein [Microlunatus soli]